jgi:hypothetical protein
MAWKRSRPFVASEEIPAAAATAGGALSSGFAWAWTQGLEDGL